VRQPEFFHLPSQQLSFGEIGVTMCLGASHSAPGQSASLHLIFADPWSKEWGQPHTRSNRKQQYHCGRHLYKERHLVECFINKIKHYRRIFSRFDKLARRYLGFLSFAGALIWLR
jgi:hypothetical protein